MVNDLDTVLDPLTKEVKETGPDGQEVTKVIPAATPEIKDALAKNIRRRMTPQPIKFRADIEMKCFQFDGVLHIKDLIPPSYLEELSVLQDRITPFSNEVAVSTIEAELGLSIDKLFSEISSKPVAAASLGQVYRARLRSTVQVVAIKVQRPGV